MRKATWLLAAVAAAVLALAATAGATSRTVATATAADATPAAAPFAQAWAKVPRTLAARKAKRVAVIGMEQDIDGFNTALSCCNSYWAAQAGNVPELRGAYVITNTLKYVPDLATKISVTRKTLSYTIRKNAYWYWGGKKLPVTYKDFVYTWKAFVDPKNDVVSRDGYDLITGYTHKGPKQITFHWKKPYADYQDLFGGIYPSAALKGMDFDKIWARCVCGSNGKPVSDGPFYLSHYTRGSGVTLKRNPYWYGRKPGLNEIDFKIITDTNSEIQAMRGGEVDAIQPSPQTALSTLKHVSGMTYSSIPGLYQEHVDFQFGKKASSPLLRAPWFRHAVMMGVNRQAIIKALFGSIAPGLTPLNSLLYYQSDKQNYRPDFAKWNYDPKASIALLKKHCTGGPSSPGGGGTWTCSGYPAKFAYTTTAGNSRRETSEAIVKAELSQIGIQVDDNLVPASVMFGPTVLEAGNYDVMEFAWVTSPDPGAFNPIWGCGGESNYMGYCNRKMTNLLTASNTQLNVAKRAALFRRADALMAQDLPSIPLYAAPTILVHKTKFAGMKNNPAVIGFTWNIQDWKWRS